VAVDGGQTGMRLRVRAGARTADSEVGGFGYRSDAQADPVAVNADLFARAWAGLPDWARGPVDTAALGLTGQLGDPSAAARLAAQVHAITGARRVRISEDAVTGHLGALAGRPGVVLAAGTGTVALAIAPDGRSHRVDGWGHLLGDGGSGFAVGQAGLRLVVEAADGRGPATPLTEPARRRYGPIDTLPTRLYRSPTVVADVAAFAVDVVAAARVGDPPAKAIIAQAVDELAGTALAAIDAYRRLAAGDERPDRADRADPSDQKPAVSYVGGMFAAGDLVLEPWRALLASTAPSWPVCPPIGGGLAGAELLAAGREPAGWPRLLDFDGPA
jgi:N-acetylglucosamine kinase-like BadF-type ATPase